uniref:AP-3 complex subunit sigma-like n=1 Tax=Rhizophora mucronata TaxID=61149 RepID=A0A2P2JIH7_RHIMU
MGHELCGPAELGRIWDSNPIPYPHVSGTIMK